MEHVHNNQLDIWQFVIGRIIIIIFSPSTGLLLGYDPAAFVAFYLHELAIKSTKQLKNFKTEVK